MKASVKDVDHGWAWIVALGVTLWNMLFCGILRSFGLLYVELLQVFDARPGVTSWVPGAFAISVTLIAPVSGYLSDRYSVRNMVLLAGFLGTLGFLVTAYASTIYVAIVGYGIITGSAGGMVDGPILAHLTRFFQKRRAVANGIAFAGSSIGTLILPLVFAFLIQEYTVRGTFVITAGLWLHVCVVGMILRPIILTCDETVISGPCIEAQEHNSNINTQNNSIKPSNDPIKKDTVIYDLIKSENETNGLNETAKLESDTCEIKQEKLEKQMTYKPQDEKICRLNTYNLQGDPYSETSDCLVGFGAISLSSKNKLYNKDDVCKPMINGYCDTEKKEKTKIDSQSSTGGMAVFKLLTSLDFLKLVFFLFCGFFGYLNNLFLLPPYAKDIGVDLIGSSVIVSTAGFADLASRLLFGFLGDLSFIRNRRPLVATAAFFICGPAGLMVPSFPTYINTIAYAFVIGLFGGIFVVYMSSMIADTIGEENLGVGMGVSAMTLGIASSVGPLIFGVLKEEAGSYSYGVRLCGGMYLLGGLVFLLRRNTWKMLKDIF